MAFGTKRWLPGLAAAAASLLACAAAHASADLPLRHWAYEDIERLTALGVIDRAMVSAKPYSRKLAARYVARGLRRADAGGEAHEALAAPLLARLARELRPELIRLGVVAPAAGEEPRPVRHGGGVELELADFRINALQPARPRENAGGEYYTDGAQARAELRAWVEVGDWAALALRPGFFSEPRSLGIEPLRNDDRAVLREGSLKLLAGNVALQAGRIAQWWGAGYRGSLLLTDHAFALDMVKLGAEEPFRLPGRLRGLGEWKADAFLAELKSSPDFPRTRLFGLRIGALPADWLELGLTRLTQFDWPGFGQEFPQAVIDTYASGANQPGNRETNEQVMIDFRARVPATPYLAPFPAGMQVYGEIGSEDKWSKPRPSRGAFLAGVYVPQLFAGDTTDLRVEYADTDFTRRNTGFPGVWYDNSTYTTGMRMRGLPLGHWMGTDAAALFVRATRRMAPRLQLGLQLEAAERRRGNGPVHEKKREAGVDLAWWFSDATRVSAGYARQWLENPGQIVSVSPVYVETFVPSGTVENDLFWVRLEMDY